MNQSIKFLTSALLTSALLASSALAFPYQDPADAAKKLTAPQATQIVAPGLAASDVGKSVRVRVTIDETGQATHVRVLSSVNAGLNRRIVEAVKQWRFEPAMRDGKAVKVRAVLPIELKLDQAS